MGREIKIRLTAAQQGAFECLEGGGLEPEDSPQMAAAWRGKQLVFNESDREALWREINEASNSEDAQADALLRADLRRPAALAARAARTLGNLAGKVLMATERA